MRELSRSLLVYRDLQTVSRPERQVRRWAAGAYPVPVRIAAWLEGMAGYAESHPAPAPDRGLGAVSGVAAARLPHPLTTPVRRLRGTLRGARD